MSIPAVSPNVFDPRLSEDSRHAASNKLEFRRSPLCTARGVASQDYLREEFGLCSSVVIQYEFCSLEVHKNMSNYSPLVTEILGKTMTDREFTQWDVSLTQEITSKNCLSFIPNSNNPCFNFVTIMEREAIHKETFSRIVETHLSFPGNQTDFEIKFNLGDFNSNKMGPFDLKRRELTHFLVLDERPITGNIHIYSKHHNQNETADPQDLRQLSYEIGKLTHLQTSIYFPDLAQLLEEN